MRVLFVSLSVPYPPGNGQRMRNWSLVQTLFEEGHEVTLVSFAEPREMASDGECLRRTCRDVRFVPLPVSAVNGSATYGTRLRAFLCGLPYGVWRFRSAAINQGLRELLMERKFDVVICDDIYQIANLPRCGSLPVLLNKHDITHVIFQRYLAHETNPMKFGYGWAEYRKLRRWEAQACGDVAVVWACSQNDRTLLRALSPKARVTVVPNAIDAARYAPQEEPSGKTILYFGAMDWYPNQDAVGFFISAVLPELQELVPGVKFIVAGRDPSEEFRRKFAAIPEVEFTGTVPDMRAEISRAAVCVVPLRIGSGTRLKILEAAAMARPIVSTRIGAEGLDFVDGKEILLADEPMQFAQAVADLLADPARRRALGLTARRRVEEQYSFAVLRRAVRKALAELAGGASAVRQQQELSLSRAEGRP